MKNTADTVNKQLRLFARFVSGFISNTDFPLQGRVFHLKKDNVFSLFMYSEYPAWNEGDSQIYHSHIQGRNNVGCF